MRVWSFGEGGAVAGGEVSLLGDNRMAFDWNIQTREGESQRYYIEETLEDKDSLRFMLFYLKPGDRAGQKPGDGEPLVNVVWKRSPLALQGRSSLLPSPLARTADPFLDRR